MKTILITIFLFTPIWLIAQDFNIVEPTESYQLTPAHPIHWLLAFLALILNQVNRIQKVYRETKKEGESWRFDWGKLFNENIFIWVRSIISVVVLMMLYNLSVAGFDNADVTFSGVPFWAKILIYTAATIFSFLFGWWNYAIIKLIDKKGKAKTKIETEDE
jgi:hypothetical protein